MTVDVSSFDVAHAYTQDVNRYPSVRYVPFSPDKEESPYKMEARPVEQEEDKKDPRTRKLALEAFMKAYLER